MGDLNLLKIRVSVVIKTYDDTEVHGHNPCTSTSKNYLKSILDSLVSQQYQPYEVIIIDTSKRLGIANLLKEFASSRKTIIVRRVYLNAGSFSHPKALNYGIKESVGDIVVSLSGDAIPASSLWLKNMIKPFANPKVAGVWGRQIENPAINLPYLEKFRLWWRYRKKTFTSQNLSLLSNANSAFRRSLALEFPFDESLQELEDYKWAKVINKQGYILVYQCDAEVYHSHASSSLNILRRMIYYFHLRLLIDLNIK